jgi:hypothetical protein
MPDMKQKVLDDWANNHWFDMHTGGVGYRNLKRVLEIITIPARAPGSTIKCPAPSW